MDVIVRKKNSETPMEFTMDLTEKGKVLADIIDVYCSIKDNHASTDTILFYKTKLTNGITLTQISTYVFKVEVAWSSADYVGLTLNKVYDIGVFPKFTGETYANEDVDKIYKIKIIQDYMRA